MDDVIFFLNFLDSLSEAQIDKIQADLVKIQKENVAEHKDYITSYVRNNQNKRNKPSPNIQTTNTQTNSVPVTADVFRVVVGTMSQTSKSGIITYRPILSSVTYPDMAKAMARSNAEIRASTSKNPMVGDIYKKLIELKVDWV